MIIVRNPNKGVYLKDDFKTILTTKYDPYHNYGEPLLCWGCSIPNGVNTVLNNTSFGKISNKPVFRRLMEESEVRIPKTYYVPEKIVFEGKKYIGRPSYHRSGQNLRVVFDQKSLEESVKLGDTYWSEYIPKDRELRVFVGFGRVWAQSEKFIEDKSQVAWNYEQGGHFDILKWGDWSPRACYMSLLASKVSGLVIGSFDLIHYENKWYML